MKLIKGLLIIICFLVISRAEGQISLVGGANVNVLDDQPLNKIRYFGGAEFKINISERFKVYLLPQYAGLAEKDLKMEAAMLPIGISFQVNEMWDEKTPLFRLIDINIGGYGDYIFKANHNESEVTENFGAFNYGVHVSTKMRLFVFLPLYISYNHGLGSLDIIGEGGYKQSSLQVGVYLPVYHWFKYY